MTVGEIIQRVLSMYSRGVQSDDSRLTSRHVYNKLLTVRSKLIKEKANSYRKLVYQRLDCIRLEDRPISECLCVPKHILCTLKRSLCPLPKIITARNGYLIDSVITLDMETKFFEIPTGRKSYASGNKYTKDILNQYFIQDNYLYIIPNKENRLLEIVQMFAVFEDIIIPKTFKDCSCNAVDVVDCESPLDKEFSIDADLIEPLIVLTLEELMLFLRMRQDNLNNSQNNNQEQPVQHQQEN